MKKEVVKTKGNLPMNPMNSERKFLKSFAIQKCRSDFKKVATIFQAVQKGAPSLSLACRKFGGNFVKLYLELWLIDLNELTAVKKPLNLNQIGFISDQIINEYRNLTVADIYLIFNNAATGIYGKLYESMSPVEVLIWFREYYNERLEVCAQITQQEHLQQKENPHEPRSSEMTVKGALKQMRENETKRKKRTEN